jgi:molybdopterin converting factor small subunit
MKISVKLFSYLANLAGKGEDRTAFAVEMEKGATCDDLVRVLKLPAHIPLSILIKGAVKEKNYALQEGDEVSILPPIEGG